MKAPRGIILTALASLIITICFLPELLALDPKKRITQYDIRVYQAEHGLPMNDIKSVFQDSKGYIWVATQEGLARFNGQTFTLFDKSKYPGLAEDFIWDIEEDWDGNLWLATQGGGVSRFDGRRFVSFDTSDGLTSNIVTQIEVSDSQRTIWFGTHDGVTAFRDGRFVPYSQGLGKSVYALSAAQVGQLTFSGSNADGFTFEGTGTSVGVFAEMGIEVMGVFC